jgi:hypothetical protein
MDGEPAVIFLNEKNGTRESSRERCFSPNQLNQFDQLNPLGDLNQVNKEIEIVSI